MQVLIANIPLPENRFLEDLESSLRQFIDITRDESSFWARRGSFDVVHLHFPEYATFLHQSAYSSGLNDQLIHETEDCLRWWRERARLVITRHNILPHDARHAPHWEKMYETVYRNVHVVVHFASASVDEFKVRYRQTNFAHGEPSHTVIPHHNYASLPNKISREEARDQLGIAMDRKVMLVFGAIRNFEESRLVLNTFKALPNPRKLLLVSNWREQLSKVSWIRLKYWLRDLNRLYCRLHPQYHFNYGFVEEADTQLWLNAADVLFIPRLKVLNSGNITLGMSFGKVVVGPDSWDVGQLLRETGNPVFDPDRPETAVEAVEQGFRLAAEGHRGPENQRLALSEWSAEQCARQYLQVFKDVCGKPADQR